MNGSWNNGIPLVHGVPTIANVLHDEANYRTALIGKAHWEPFSAPDSLEAELGMSNRYGPLRGFDHAELAGHNVLPESGHYQQWLKRYYPEHYDEYYSVVDNSGPTVIASDDFNSKPNRKPRRIPGLSEETLNRIPSMVRAPSGAPRAISSDRICRKLRSSVLTGEPFA